MDLKTRLELVEYYYENGPSATAALRAYKTKLSLVDNPFSLESVRKLINKFKQHGVVIDLSKTQYFR